MVDTSTGYPVLVGLTFVLVATGGVLRIHEAVGWPKALGLLVIVTGLVLVGRT